MPSDAYQNFRENLTDVERLIGSHSQLNHEGGGRRGLGHITRSGVVMLCAAWEVYIEEVVMECVEYFGEYLDQPSDLPKSVKKNLSRKVKKADHELKPLELAGEGWKDLYKTYAEESIGNLHTPRCTKINYRFNRYVGVDDVSEMWSEEGEEIDGFVSDRGEIAHNGRHARYIQIGTLKNHLELIRRTAAETDNSLADYMKNHNPANRQPWYKIDLDEFE